MRSLFKGQPETSRAKSGFAQQNYDVTGAATMLTVGCSPEPLLGCAKGENPLYDLHVLGQGCLAEDIGRAVAGPGLL